MSTNTIGDEDFQPLLAERWEWDGPLTLVVRAAASLAWDLGDTRGTVAVRMPLQPVALEVLNQTGPLAVSSANRSGLPPATDSPLAALTGDAVSATVVAQRVARAREAGNDLVVVVSAMGQGLNARTLRASSPAGRDQSSRASLFSSLLA